jgi:hypothetical protein
MKTNLLFQQCWNGKDLWLPDSAHVVRPTGGSTKSGACPWSHPIKLPTLLLEYTWRTFEYNPGAPLAGNLAWANGDTTGYGIHGDFVNGSGSFRQTWYFGEIIELTYLACLTGGTATFSKRHSTTAPVWDKVKPCKWCTSGVFWVQVAHCFDHPVVLQVPWMTARPCSRSTTTIA